MVLNYSCNVISNVCVYIRRDGLASLWVPSHKKKIRCLKYIFFQNFNNSAFIYHTISLQLTIDQCSYKIFLWNIIDNRLNKHLWKFHLEFPWISLNFRQFYQFFSAIEISIEISVVWTVGISVMIYKVITCRLRFKSVVCNQSRTLNSWSHRPCIWL